MNYLKLAACALSLLGLEVALDNTISLVEEGKEKAFSTDLANTLLWKIEGKEIQSPSYLFGTIHLICPDDYKMFDKVAKAIDEVETLALELDMDDPNMMSEMQATMLTGEKLSETLSKKDYAIVEAFVAENVELPMVALDRFSLETISILGLTKNLGCDEIKSYEMELMALAQADSMKVIGLETVKEQMEFLDNAYDEKEMIKQLKDYDEFIDMLHEVVELYTEQRLQECSDLLNDSEGMTDDADYWLLEHRNKNWVKSMTQQMKEGSLLYAVGAAHVAGEHGLIALLRAEGYTVSPVMD